MSERKAKAVTAARAAAMAAASELARDGMRSRGWSSLDLSDASGVPWPDLVRFLHGEAHRTPVRDVNAVMGVFGMRMLAPTGGRSRRRGG